MNASTGRPRVFVGSSTEGLEIAHHVQLALSRDFEVLCWDQGAFQLMKGIWECLHAAAEWCDFAVLVATPDHVTHDRGKPAMTPRDNVVFEAGYFIGALGINRTFIVKSEEDDLILPSDLQGIVFAEYVRSASEELEAALNSATLRILKAARKLGPRSRINGPRTYPNSESGDFLTYMEKALASAKRVILVGTGLNILHRDHIRRDLIARVRDDPDFSLEIILADPNSPSVESRLAEEELSQETKVTVGRSGLQQRLRRLLEEFPVTASAPQFSLRMFRHYPTFALLIVDDHYFVYPYGYATLGNVSPVLSFNAGEDSDQAMVRFLSNHVALVRAASVDARRLHQLRNDRSRHSEDLHAFAVYLVPAADSDLYQFGSTVLGFDVRAGQTSHSPWASLTGGAELLGFHLTLCDVLYFLSAEEVRLAIEELRMLAMEFSPFTITKLKVRPDFPDERSVAIAMEDPQGGLEILHFEMVHRFHRRAVASNYSLGLTTRSPSTAAGLPTQLMRRYLAPYILSAYRPHFTLLTAVPESEGVKVAAEIQTEFASRVGRRTLEVDRLAVMELREHGGHWSIREEIPLGIPAHRGFSAQ